MSAFRINTNVPSLVATRFLSQANGRITKNLERLSSGLRINSAADDPAGFAVSQRLQTQSVGLKQAQRNASDGISLIQTAEGGLAQISSILQRLRVLSVQGANDTLTTADRRLIQIEFNQLISEVGRQASTTVFNGKNLLNGSLSGVGANAQTINLQVGANQGDVIKFNIASVSSAGLGISVLTVTTPSSAVAGGVITQASAASAISVLDTAINKVSELRADIGAIQNRVTNAFDFIGIARENADAATSTIRDADFAVQIADLTKNQIIVQAATSALRQANLQPQNALALLR